MNELRQIRYIIFIGLIILLIPVSMYIINFYKEPISNSANVWGSFGDFFSGILNPIIGLMNLAVFIVLTLYLARLDERRDQVTYQRQAYKEFIEIFNSLEWTASGLNGLRYVLENYKVANRFVFRTRDNMFDRLFDEMIFLTDKVAEVREKFEDQIKDGTAWEGPAVSPSFMRTIMTAFKGMRVEDEETLTRESFFEKKNEIQSFLQSYMLDQH